MFLFHMVFGEQAAPSMRSLLLCVFALVTRISFTSFLPTLSVFPHSSLIPRSFHLTYNHVFTLFRFDLFSLLISA